MHLFQCNRKDDFIHSVFVWTYYDNIRANVSTFPYSVHVTKFTDQIAYHIFACFMYWCFLLNFYSFLALLDNVWSNSWSSLHTVRVLVFWEKSYHYEWRIRNFIFLFRISDTNSINVWSQVCKSLWFYSNTTAD